MKTTTDKTEATPTAPSHRAATLHDVARAAGVSLITASRALGNPGVVTPRTIEKVRLAVEATGYLPNRLAGGLRSRRSMTVAALVPAISVQQFLPTVQAMTEALHAAGYQVILGQSGYDPAREDELLATMLGRQPDGIVVTGLIHSVKTRDMLRRMKMPVVETWDLSHDPVDMLVGFSHRQVGAGVADFLMGKGWTRLGIATGDDHRAHVRRQAFVDAIGRPVPTAVVPAPSNLALGRQALGELLAQGVMVEALARGLRVPQDLAICGFGDADFAAHTQPSMTTVQVDGAGIGRRAASLILDRCRGVAIEQPVTDIGFRIIERQSTGA